MNAPHWYGQLLWSPAHEIRALKPKALPPGSGIYAFTSSPEVLSPKNVLYIGKADGEHQTLRSRIAVYLRRFATFPGGQPAKHKGMEQLAEYYGRGTRKMYVLWTGVVVARDIEGSLIGLFDPSFNNKDEHRFGFDDDELIPDYLLYTWGPTR